MFRKKFKITKSRFTIEVPEDLVGKEVELKIIEIKNLNRLTENESKANVILNYLEYPIKFDNFIPLNRENIYDK